MLKKISFVSGACVLLCLSFLASAQSAPAPLSAPGLGTLEGMLDFCVKVNPHDADKYKEMRKSLTKDQTAKAVDDIRRSQEYKDSHDQMSKRLESLSAKEASATCKAQGK